MIKDILEKLALKNDLTKEEMQSAVESIMTGKVDDNDIETFLIALNEKGVKEPEITAAAMVMKDKSLKFDIGDGTHIDTCGTGGTGLHTFNCSTASSFVAAAGGASITKHGNKAISSKSGSADFLIEAGADISHDREKLVKVFDQVGFIFLFAPLHHQSMKYVMPARQRIGEKTIFNLLGPHTNPCGAKRQIIGVYDKSLLNTFSTVAKNLDME
ncbi:anthranilate phosphoribosyltransferase, partial [Gammaproteobacteria bacterium]|nr:anthranilate phosphoribosyltransferase [Gammaproteobacteria bacterium]